MAQKMASVGADSVLVATPCFYKSGMTREALEHHYTKVILINTGNTRLCLNLAIKRQH